MRPRQRRRVGRAQSANCEAAARPRARALLIGVKFGGFGEGEDFTLTSESYAHFLNETFREYRRDFLSGNYISVRQFDNFVRIAAGLGAECCGMGGACSASLVVEADGGVYPCDFYVLDKWKMGNIVNDSPKKLLSSPAAREFVSSSGIIDGECRDCPYLGICRGGCRRHREDSLGFVGKNRYCAAYRAFFEKNLDGIVDMAEKLKAGNNKS